MIQSIYIEYKQIGSEFKWVLYRYISIDEEISGTSEIILLRRAFGTFFEFRTVVSITEPITLRIYDRNFPGGWREI